jgi:hypothetical protein
MITEPAWNQTAVYFNTFMFDLPNAESHPSPQVGFVFHPGFTWAFLGMFELNVGFPIVVNPDAQGKRELNAAKKNPTLEDRPYWDPEPDLDLPGIRLGLKWTALGKKGEDKFFLAVGVDTTIPVYGSRSKFETNFMPPKTEPYHTNTFRVAPYLAAGYDLGRFSPQLQVGMDVRLPDEYYDPNHPPGVNDQLIEGKGRFDGFFNLALPFAMIFEGTVPMIELNGVVGLHPKASDPTKDEIYAQLFITPAISFMPKKSAALFAVACMIPIADSDWRSNEGIRVMINFSYRFDALSLPAPWDKEEEEGSAGSSEKPPAGW